MRHDILILILIGLALWSLLPPAPVAVVAPIGRATQTTAPTETIGPAPTAAPTPTEDTAYPAPIGGDPYPAPRVAQVVRWAVWLPVVGMP